MSGAPTLAALRRDLRNAVKAEVKKCERRELKRFRANGDGIPLFAWIRAYRQDSSGGIGAALECGKPPARAVQSRYKCAQEVADRICRGLLVTEVQKFLLLQSLAYRYGSRKRPEIEWEKSAPIEREILFDELFLAEAGQGIPPIGAIVGNHVTQTLLTLCLFLYSSPKAMQASRETFKDPRKWK